VFGARTWSVIVAGGILASALPIVAAPAPAGAADSTPWTAPVRPALCTAQQAASGSVAGCLLDGPEGLPDLRGWPSPKFPDASGATPFVTVSLGATGEIVRRIQNALTLKGVATPVDGSYGPTTQTAVQTFQQKSALGVTGTVDATTATALGIYSPGGGQPVPWTTLQEGSTGDAVRAVQVALNNNGAHLVTDGQFGAQTEAAVMTYQTGKGLTATGVVDAALADMLGVRAYSGGFPAGWTWSGWGFNNSYALLGWESAVVSNQEKIGPVNKGAVRSVAGAQPLFEGFVRDIVAGGYQIKDIGGYVFRCTSNSRKDCQGLTRSSLSNHSWGMAVDINVGANPELRYANCQVPLTTDFPQWVVQTAEKWGLYWGGYGWGRGCASASDTSTGIIRDVMHFEFRGTPAQAAAILAFNGGLPVNLPPGDPQTPAPACTSYVDGAGQVTGVCLDGSRPRAESRLVVHTSAPADASAALVNITVADPAAAGYVTAESCGATAAGDRASSNGNYAAGQTVANVSVVPVDSRGWFCVYTSAAAHVIVDVQGYLTPAGGSLLNVVEPRRVTDTRNGPACAPDGSCTPRGPVATGALQQVVVDGIDQATAVLANLTVTDPAAAGYLTADACGSLTAGEQTRSNANFAAGQTVANLSVVPTVAVTGGQALCIYANQRLHDIVDIQGYFTPAASGGLGLRSQTAERLIDTRQTQRPAAGSITKLQAPPGVSAALVNITLTGSAGAGYVTADRCSALTAGEQTKSNGNFATGRTVANLSVVPVDEDGSFCIYNSAAVDIIVDIQGTLGAGSGAQFQPVTPIRKLDTRQH
jgi:peptidoglycan hydrolase-like protein with peptidoglycan-binding domain